MAKTEITIWQGVKSTRIYHIICLKRHGQEVLVRQWGKIGFFGQVKVERGSFTRARQYRKQSRGYETVFEIRTKTDLPEDSLMEIVGRSRSDIPEDGYQNARTPLSSAKIVNAVCQAHNLLCGQDPIDARPEYQAPEPDHEPEIDITELAQEGFGAW